MINRMGRLRKRCLPPVHYTERWCESLRHVLQDEANERRSGVAVYSGIKFSTGKGVVFGVAARRSAKDTPIWFRVCPYCGEKIDWNVPGNASKVGLRGPAAKTRRPT